MQLRTHSLSHIPISLSPISAGFGHEAGEDHGLLDINELITGGREGFAAYTVSGDSMVSHICPGNIIFVDTWSQPINGQIVAALVNGKISVKVFQRSHRGLYLVSKNPDYKTREIVPTDTLHILGVVKANLALGSQLVQ